MSSCSAWLLVGDRPKIGCERDSEDGLVLSPRAHWKDTVHLVIMYGNSASSVRGLRSFLGENATEMHFTS